jgi:molybdopterin synthase sulfur carrier subunit
VIRVLFFGGLREALGVAELEMDAAAAGNVAGLRASLMARGEDWERALAVDNLLCAVNQVQVQGSAPVSDGDEVAFFPPVTGG